MIDSVTQDIPPFPVFEYKEQDMNKMLKDRSA